MSVLIITIFLAVPSVFNNDLILTETQMGQAESSSENEEDKTKPTQSASQDEKPSEQTSFVEQEVSSTNEQKNSTETQQGDSTTKININTSTKQQLTQLKGIGVKTAQAIIDYRTQNGKFEKIDDLINVKGIGEKKFDAIKQKIIV